MKHSLTLLAAGAAVLVSAAPLKPRGVATVYVTEYEVVYVTQDVIEDVWVDPTDSVALAAGPVVTAISTVGEDVPEPKTTTVQPVVEAYSEPKTQPTITSTTTSTPPTPTPDTYQAPSSDSASAPVQQPTTPVTTSSQTPAEVPASYSKQADTSTSSSGLSSGLGSSGTTYTGDLTWYDTGLGACGETSSSTDNIVAISETIFDSYLAAAGGNPNNNPLCGKTVTITGKDGKEHTARIVDRCPGCKEGSLDLSKGFFDVVTGAGDGRVPGMSWKFD